MALHLCRSFSGSAAVLGLRTSTSAVQHAAYHPNGCMVQQRALATSSSCFPSLSSPFTLDTTHHLSNHVAAGSRAAPPLPGRRIGARFQSSVRHIHTSSTAALPAASTSKNPWVLGGGVEVDGTCPSILALPLPSLLSNLFYLHAKKPYAPRDHLFQYTYTAEKRPVAALSP